MPESTADVYPAYYYSPTCLEGRVFASQEDVTAASADGPWTRSKTEAEEAAAKASATPPPTTRPGEAPPLGRPSQPDAPREDDDEPELPHAPHGGGRGMPRDFIPCQYTEQVLEDDVSQVSVKRCQVIECFEGVHIATRGLLFTMSLDSHAHHMDTDVDDDRVREHLFAHFYSAMAELE